MSRSIPSSIRSTVSHMSSISAIARSCTPGCRTVRGLVLVAAVGAVAACSSSSDPTPADPNVIDLTQNDFPMCDELAGDPTEEVASYFQDGGACGRDVGLDDPEGFIGFISSEECVDGTFVYWQDTGWGVTDGTWNTGASLPPEEILATCRGE